MKPASGSQTSAGGEAIHVTVNEAASVAQEQATNVVALDEALKNPETIDPKAEPDC